MKRARLAIILAVAVLLLAACQDPEKNPLVRPGPGEWDASVWNQAQWE